MTVAGGSAHLSFLYIRRWLMYQLLGSVMPNSVGRDSRLMQLSSIIRGLQRFHRADTGGKVCGIVTGFFVPLRFIQNDAVVLFNVAQGVDDSQVFFDFAGDGFRRDVVFGVEFLLQGAAAVCFVDGFLQTFGHVVGEKEHGAVHVAARAAHRLDEAPVIA